VQTDTGKIQSHQFNLRNLVFSSPFQQGKLHIWRFDTKGDLLFLGSKFTKIFVIDANSGDILSSFTTSNELECPSLSEIAREGTVIVGRADYTIRFPFFSFFVLINIE
jgi:WD40 repeat protein